MDTNVTLSGCFYITIQLNASMSYKSTIVLFKLNYRIKKYVR